MRVLQDPLEEARRERLGVTTQELTRLGTDELGADRRLLGADGVDGLPDDVEGLVPGEADPLSTDGRIDLGSAATRRT